jgi:glycosyltransferase involved in cell wall biosynthesis
MKDIKKIKIFIMLPTLHAGGAERIMSFLAQNLNKDKFNVTLVVNGLEEESKYEVTSCPVIFLNKKKVRNGIFSLFKLILIERPQIVFSSIGDLNIVLGYISIFFPSIKFVGRRAAISGVLRHLKGSKYKKRSILGFDYLSFGLKRLDFHICQSNDMKENLMSTHGIKDKFIKVINNPITQKNQIKQSNSGEKTKKFITVGRLSMGKGHIRILNSLYKLTFPYKYTIIGDGPYYDKIFHEIKTLGLEKHVNHIKYTNNVSKYLIEHDMFLQGSYTEGFPNALLESCAVGIPVLAYNVPGGTKEIVENEINGFLVENDDEFLEKLNDKREWIPNSIRESVYKKFNKDKILRDYENFFIGILN